MAGLLEAHPGLQVGEIGIDFCSEAVAKKEQLRLFELQLDLAISTVPIIRVPPYFFHPVRGRPW